MPKRPPAELLRFTHGERWVHRATAILMGICLATAGILYVDVLSQLFGHRALVEWIHVLAGIALPVPILFGLLSKSRLFDLQQCGLLGNLRRSWSPVSEIC